MKLTDEDVAAIDAAAEVLRRVAADDGPGPLDLTGLASFHVAASGIVGLMVLGRCIHASTDRAFGMPSPGEALRRLVAR